MNNTQTQKKIDQRKLSEAKKLLNFQAKKNPDEVFYSKQELVNQLQDVIQKLLDKGYKLSDISTFLEKADISIKPTTLKTLWGRCKKTKKDEEKSDHFPQTWGDILSGRKDDEKTQ